MKTLSSLVLATALAGMTVAAPAMAKDKPAAAAKLTPAVQNALAEAQKATSSGDFATAQAKVDQAKAAIATDDDRYVTGSIEYKLGQAKKDEAMTSDGVDLMAASGKAAPDLQRQLLSIQGQRAYQAKDFRKAEAAFAAAQAAGSTNPDLTPLLVSSMQLNGETLKALTTLGSSIDAATAAGQTVPDEWYQRGIAIGSGTKAGAPDVAAIRAATSDLSIKWVKAYPTKQHWHDAMLIYLTQNQLPTDVQIDGFRLLRAAGALQGDSEYREYADDVYLRYPNEAKTVLEEGSAKGVVNLSGKSDAAEVLTIVKGKVAADLASLPAADRSARAAAGGKSALSTADAYVGYGDYAKAIDLYKVALAKGGVDAPVANLHMGWAQALSGDAAGAKRSFAAVTGPRKVIADFWVVHLDHPTVG